MSAPFQSHKLTRGFTLSDNVKATCGLGSSIANAPGQRSRLTGYVADMPAGASITDRATRLQDFRRNAIVCNSSLCGLSRSKVAISAAVADRHWVGKISRPHPRHAPTPICRARTSPTSSLKTHTSVPSLGAVAIGSYLPRSTMGCHPLGLIGALIYGLPIRPFNGSNWSGDGYPSGKY